MASLLSLSEYKALNNITTSDYDAQISALLENASDYVRKYCGRDFGVAEYSEGPKQGSMDVKGRFVFAMDQIPVQSIQSIEIGVIGAPGVSATLDVSQITLFGDMGVAKYAQALNLEGQGLWRPEYLDEWFYNVVYSGGQAAPGGVKQAVAVLVHNMAEYLNRTSTALASGQQTLHGELVAIKIGDYSEDYVRNSLFADMNKGGEGLVMTKTVEDLLSP